jgi:peptidoglycan/xylan/chitin deacetylase (PgdA/CDA1 family)
MLSEDRLVEIGAHGVSHLLLASQPADVQWREISESKRHLEGILGRPVTSFAYPYGGSAHVGEETIHLVQQAGFELGCANVAASVTRRSELFWLPRYLVRDWDGYEFARRLEKAFDG